MISSPFSDANSNRISPSPKPKILVIDDEQDNLDLLYRTFRRDFVVFRADGGLEALEILAREGEMAAIISDQRMPEMKGTEFFSRTVLDFPDTIRIVLTGYTDITDLIEAINSGQVHKYITKPWEPDQLKSIVTEATQTYDLLKLRSEELRRSQAQNAMLAVIVEIAQRSTQINDCLLPLVNAFNQNFEADSTILQLVESGRLVNICAACGDYDRDLAEDALVQMAIAKGQSQVALRGDANAAIPQTLQTNLAIAITFREQMLGILSMGWLQADALTLGDVAALQQCADEVALALTCIRYYA